MIYDFSAIQYHEKTLEQLKSGPGPRLKEAKLRSESFDYERPTFDNNKLLNLPVGSSWLQFNFILATPYASKDDSPPAPKIGEDPNHTESPIVREWVYRIPMVKPTTWKGNLLFAARQLDGDGDAAKELRLRMFGNEKHAGDEEDSTALREGALHFFPTFFKDEDRPARQELQVINRHDRKTRRGIGPINIGSVPPTSHGVFSLLYVEKEPPMSDKLPRLALWVSAMFTLYGFGAKKLKGWGLSEQRITGVSLAMKKTAGWVTPAPSEETTFADLPKLLTEALK